jgi:hypothetical protein
MKWSATARQPAQPNSETRHCPFCGSREFTKRFVDLQLAGLYDSLRTTIQQKVMCEKDLEEEERANVVFAVQVKLLIRKNTRLKREIDDLKEHAQKVAEEVVEQFLREAQQ